MVHRRARVHQHFHALDVPLLARKEERRGPIGAWRGLVAGRFGAHVGAAADEELEAHQAAALRGYHERCEAQGIGLLRERESLCVSEAMYNEERSSCVEKKRKRKKW